jgi:hypothetical protein
MKGYMAGILLVSILLALSFGTAMAQNDSEAMDMIKLLEMLNSTGGYSAENSTMPQDLGIIGNEEGPHVINIVLSNVSLSIIGIQNLTTVNNNMYIVPNAASSMNNSTELGIPPAILPAAS